MIRRDKIDADDIAEVIDWCQNDNFWRSNILSGKKVREKYQQLVMKMKSKRETGAPSGQFAYEAQLKNLNYRTRIKLS